MVPWCRSHNFISGIGKLKLLSYIDNDFVEITLHDVPEITVNLFSIILVLDKGFRMIVNQNDAKFLNCKGQISTNKLHKEFHAVLAKSEIDL